ncbi:MAG TPA: hypothetical protein VJ975_02610 [Candidatus Limnocylindria bacterium]|nr:hypothetical protein [Candidatus Limnocylindria bacterium]
MTSAEAASAPVHPTRMATFLRRADVLRWVGMACIGLGVAVLIIYAWVEYINNPGISLIDGYWIGRVPWTPAGVVLIMGGSVATQLAGTAIVLLLGDWMRRLLLVPVLIPPFAWWLTALGVVPFPRFLGPDPVTLAYSLPQAAAVSLILPALAVTALALVPMQPDRRVRLRPVHDERSSR